MKQNIYRVNLDGYPSPKGKWWKWEEYCDKCGVETGQRNFVSSKKPDTSEADFCHKCYRELFDNKISYKEAVKKYKGV